MNPSGPSLVVLHLSDLHFGPYLQGVDPVGEWSAVAPPHSFNLLQGMEVRVREIVRKQKGRLIVVVTGDLTTAAEPPAYEAVNNYLRDNPFVSSLLRVGLELQEIRDRMFIVPGNHDVWLYGSFLSRWKKHVDRRAEYARYFPESLPNAYPLVIGEISVTVFTLDTNRVTSFNPFNFTNVLGRGEVGRAQIGQLQALHNSLANGSFGPPPAGFDYASSLKMVLMHHHLALPAGVPNNLAQELLELTDAPMILNALSDIGVRIVFCGHQHFPYQIPELRSSANPNDPVFLSCAGSATQLGMDVNSFTVYEIHHKANGTYALDVTLYTASPKQEKYFFKPSTPLPTVVV